MPNVYVETIPTKDLGRVRFGFDAKGELIEIKMRADSRSGSQHKAPKGVPSRAKLEKWLAAYMRGRQHPFPGKWQLPGGSEFARKVYAAVAALKPGETLSYGGVAERAGSAKAYRAVGTAMGKNPIPLVVP
ncbi:MAG: methylated-DNA--[protein]-cysteine S-methyltransferase [Planctomycetota bacterium]|jgi:methylated-DNA-[protein]-cysteine S-methyltransferase|nr:methylated-DNA--[protein]-cysteine S-methyltransferase [Planctomycetota bacterium]